jgi:hypothetical protein
MALVVSVALLLVLVGGAHALSRAEQISSLRSHLMTASAPLRLTANTFDDYVRSNERTYSLLVMFTALGQARACDMCR